MKKAIKILKALSEKWHSHKWHTYESHRFAVELEQELQKGNENETNSAKEQERI
jgi:hypothetical protein